MRRVIVVAFISVLALGAGATGSDAELAFPARHAAQAPLLGLVYGPSATLVRVDPGHLASAPGEALRRRQPHVRLELLGRSHTARAGRRLEQPGGPGPPGRLFASRTTIGPASFAVVRPSGEIATVALTRMLAGSRPTRSATRAEFRSVTPALAVDREGGRAFVVGAGDELAEIDLRSLAVTYRRVSRPRSLLGRLAAWLGPAAEAKSVEGPTRHAQWLGGDLLAVSGGDYSSVRQQPRATTYKGAGVRLVDTLTWVERSVAPAPTSSGWRAASCWASCRPGAPSSGCEPIGLSVYGLDDRERFQLYRGTRVWIVHADGRRAFIDRAGPGGVEVVDLATGRIVEKRQSIPAPLVGEAASDFG